MANQKPLRGVHQESSMVFVRFSPYCSLADILQKNGNCEPGGCISLLWLAFADGFILNKLD